MENALSDRKSSAPSSSASKSDGAGPPAKTETGNLPALTGEAELVRRILRALAGVEYGSVEIIIQDSKVVQIERTQRSRFSQPLEIPRV